MVGKKCRSDRETVGHFGLGERNERGTRPVQFAKTEKLKIADTFYKKKKNRKWTWKSSDRTTKNEIYQVLTSKNIIRNVDIIQRFNIGSDHRMVRAAIKINTRLERQ